MLIHGQQVQEIAELHLRGVKLLMAGFKEKAVDVHGVPVDNTFSQCGILLKHRFELLHSKLQHLDFGECNGCQRLLNAEIIRVITGEKRSRAVKADDFPSPAFVLGKVNRYTGYIVLDTIIWLSGLPEIVTFLKDSLCVRLRKEAFVKRAEVIREVISWF